MKPFEGKGIMKIAILSVRSRSNMIVATAALAAILVMGAVEVFSGEQLEFKGSLLLAVGILLAVALGLSFYGHSRRLLEDREMHHLKQVAELREKYEVLIEKSNDGVYVVSGTKITFANKKICKMLGYTPEEINGLDFSALMAPESRSVIRERFESLQRADEMQSRYGFKALTKNGRRIPVEVSVAHVRHEGKIETIGIMRDLTELSEQKELYEDLFKSSPIGLGIYKNMRTVRVNNTGARMLGYNSPSEMIGIPVFEIVHPDDLPAVQARIKQAMLDRFPAPPMEEKFLKKDGSFIHVLVLSQPVTYEGEDAVHVAFVSLEDRKKLEANLELEAAHQEEEKIRLDTLLQSLEEGILFQNPDGKIEFANAEFCRIFGFQDSTQVIGRLSKDIVIQSAHSTKFPEEFVNRVSQDVEKKAAVKMNRIEMADDSVVERSALPLFDSTGKYIGRLSVFRDITLREQNEEIIKRLQRTELLGRLAGGIAHDFNNVLGVIIGSLEMILRKTDNPNVVHENSQRALSSAIRGSEVAKRLLQFVRYSPEGFKVFSVRQIIEETVTIVKHTFEENINIHKEFVIHDASVYGSPGDIQQVLINLANNSRDAMPNGGNLTFSLTTADRKQVEKKLGSATTNQYVLLMIQDSGKGIGAEELEKIFDPFFTTKEIGKGTGLGLSIVQTIISAHGGFIEVKSRARSGTTFFIYLPMSKEEPEQAAPAPQGEAEKIDDSAKVKSVLVVEDETDLRELLAEYLSDKGLTVINAADGEEGYRIFENHPEISAVISDLGLPKLPGDMLIAKIKKARPDVRCILATGYLTPLADDILSGLDVKTIIKPYNLTAVYGLVAGDPLDKT
jgi:PAS domain S-box-containing protein